MSKPCDLCGVEYATESPLSRFCSDRCRQRKRRGAPVRPASVPAPVVRTSFVLEAVLDELAVIGVDRESYEGLRVLQLAQLMDEPGCPPNHYLAYARELERKMQDLSPSGHMWKPKARPAPVPDELAPRRARVRS